MIFNSELYRKEWLKDHGITEEDYLLMGITERNALDDAIEEERRAYVALWEEQIGADW